MLVELPLSLLTIAFLIAGGLLTAVAVVALRVGAETQVREWFIAVLVADAIWAFASAAPLEAGIPMVAFYAEVFRITASSVSALVWFSFAMVYTGREHLLSRPRLGVLAAPLVVHVVAFTTNPLHGLSATNLMITVNPTATVVSYGFGPVYLLATVYALSMVVGGSLAVLDTAVRDRQLYADQSIALSIGSLMPILGVGMTVFGVIEVGTTNVTPTMLGVTAVMYGYALFRTDLLSSGPLIASEGREIAVESLNEGFLIADGTGQVVDANPAARKLLDASRLAGRSVDSALPGSVPDTGREVLDTNEGRMLEAQVMPAAGDDDNTVGRVVTLRDVTERRRRQERVEVLNRVLRHNLRNDLNIVEGFGRQIVAHERGETTGELDIERAAERIVDRAEQLLTVAEHARTLEELLDADGEAERERVSVSGLVAETVSDVAQDTERPVECHTTLPETGVVYSNESVLRVVVEELVDNAVRHNDDPEPSIWVSVSIDDAVEIQIADDGPGIPKRERRPVLEGSETPLEHGSRLGLWMVRWGVRYLGGDLAITDRSPTGTVVTVEMPNEQPPEADIKQASPSEQFTDDAVAASDGSVTD